MAKKINRSNKKKRLVRSSSIEKTINEGKDYVNRADRRLRVRASKPQPVSAPKRAPITKNTNKKARKPRAPRRQAPPVGVPAVVPAPSLFTAPATSGVARTGSKNLSRSGSRNIARTGSKNGQIMIEQELHDRLGRHNATIGKLNFSLRWWDPNDLDLHVTCPCGTTICFMNKKCTKCGG